MANKFNPKARASVFGKAVENSIDEAKKLLNAIDFVESPQGLGVHLYPLQRLITKAIFAVPFDYKEGKVDMYDPLRSKKIRTVTESEYLHIAFEDGRTNIGDWRDLPERGYNEACVYAGRRGGKALSLDTPIPTPSGWKQMGELQIGTSVYDEQGNPSRVEYATEWMHDHSCYSVEFSDGTRIIADAEHEWATLGVPLPTYRKDWSTFADVFTTEQVARTLTAGFMHVIPSKEGFRSITAVTPCESVPVRCIKVSSPSHLFLAGEGSVPTHNSQLVSAIAAYTLYKLLNVKNPQDYYGLRLGSPVEFTFLAQNQEGSDRLFTKLSEDVNQAAFFNPYIKSSNSKELTFVTEADRGKRDVTGTIQVKSLPCTDAASRGPSSLFLAFDEFSHFRSDKGSSSAEIYSASTPATANFHAATGRVDKQGNLVLDEVTGEPEHAQESLILSISSPWTRVGKMFEIHDRALKLGKESLVFTFRCSTADMNPGILSSVLQEEYGKNPITFPAEFGGEFLDSAETYVQESMIRTCTDVEYIEVNSRLEPNEATARLNVERFHPNLIGRNYFWGLDLGISGDATALAVAHLEYRGGNKGVALVYDYIDRMMVGERFTSIGVPLIDGDNKYVKYKHLPVDDILLWLKAMHELLPCFKGATDQFGGQQLVQRLPAAGIQNVELINLNETINSLMAMALKGYMINDMCRFPYVPKFMNELRLVEEIRINNYRIKVQAPLEKGSHDDMVDSAQLCAYVAQKWLIEEGNLNIDPSGSSLAMQEQLNKPPGVIASLDGVNLSELKVLERMRKFNQNLGGMDGVVRNPFHRRGR